MNPRYKDSIFPKYVAIKMNLQLYRILNGQIDMTVRKDLFCFYFLIEHIVLDICYNNLTEAILTNIQNICFFKV